MSNVKKWELYGTSFNADELASLSGLPPSVIAARLRDGWDVDAAVTTPVKQNLICQDAAKMYACGTANIRFTEHISGVFQEMQPTLNKIYIAEPYCAGNNKQKAKIYFIITLENGKKLIVYPGEFEWLGSTAAAA